MTAIAWKNTSGGTWSVGSNWSSGTVPGGGDDVTIAVAPAAGLSGYDVVITSSVAVHSLTLDQAAATLDVTSGATFGTLATEFFLQAGTLALDGGTLTGTVSQTGGQFWVGNVFGASVGVLQSASWEGVLDPFFGTGEFGDPGSLMITDGLTLTGAGGKGAGTLVLNQSGFTVFQGQQTLDNATVELGATTGVFIPPELTEQNSASVAANLTLGQDLVVDVVGGGALVASGQMTNAGLIQTKGDGFLALQSGGFGSMFINAGTMVANAGGTIALSSTGFSNTGTMMIAAGGDLLLLPQVGDAWTNTGAILDGGTVTIGGAMTTAGLQALHISYGSAGVLSVAGTLVNSGAVLTLGTRGAAPSVLALGGTILGGTITESGGMLSAQGGTLNGVTLNGSLLLTSADASLTIAGGLALQGATFR
jgi:hypothetical protein